MYFVPRRGAQETPPNRPIQSAPPTSLADPGRDLGVTEDEALAVALARMLAKTP